MKNDPLKPPLTLLCKVASIVVHAEELISPKGHIFDHEAFKTAFQDKEVQDWLKAMGPFVPAKR